jgi:hypothetical protein
MAKPGTDLSAFVGKLLEERMATLHEGIRVLSQTLTETEVASLIAADRQQRHAGMAAAATTIGCGRRTRG